MPYMQVTWRSIAAGLVLLVFVVGVVVSLLTSAQERTRQAIVQTAAARADAEQRATAERQRTLTLLEVIKQELILYAGMSYTDRETAKRDERLSRVEGMLERTARQSAPATRPAGE